MSSVAIGTASQKLGLPVLTLWLQRRVDESEIGHWEIDRMGVVSSDFDQTLRCKARQRAAIHIHPNVFETIRPYLPKDTSIGVTTARDFLAETPEVILFGLNVVARGVKDGIQKVLFTFQHAMGSLSGLFAPKKAPSMLTDIQLTLSVRVIEDILQPSLNVAAIDPTEVANEAAEPISAFMERLRGNAHDIKFFTTLLSRFVSQAHHHKYSDYSFALANESAKTGRQLGSTASSFS